MDQVLNWLFIALYLLICLFIFLIIIGLPISISILAYIWLKKKGFGKIGIIIPIGIIIAVVYYVFTAFYPTNSFYLNEFKNNTGIKLSRNANIIAKKADYPDTHGDYCSAASIELDSLEFQNVLKRIKANDSFRDTMEIGSHVYTYVLNNTSKMDLIYYTSRRMKDKYFYIGFFSDNKTLIFHRASS